MSEVLDPNQLKSLFGEALKRTVQAPSIHGYNPQDHQLKFHNSKATGRLMLGGNRSGKTVSGATEMVWKMCGMHPYNQEFKPPLRCRAVGVDFDDGVDKIMKPEIAKWVPPSFLKNGSWNESYSKGTRTLTLSNGSFLEFMSYDQDVDKFAGTSRHHIWFDEEPPENIFNENLLRLVDTGGTWWMTMTPLIDMSWTYDRLFDPAIKIQAMGAKSSRLELFQVSSLDNKYISAAVLETLLEGFSDEEKVARTDGRYFSYTGAIYAGVTDANTFIPSIIDSDKWPVFHQKWHHFASMDCGYSNPTAFLLGCYDDEGRIIIYWEHYAAKMLVEDHARIIMQKINDLRLKEKIEFMMLDPAAWQESGITKGASYGIQYGEHGLFFGKANNNLAGGLSRVSNRFKQKKLFITMNCEKTRWELARYRWAKWDSSKSKSKNNAKETPMKKDDHAMDALRYGVVAVPITLEGEEEIFRGNILNAPMAATGFDEEFNMEKEEDFFDEFLGTDW